MKRLLSAMIVAAVVSAVTAEASTPCPGRLVRVVTDRYVLGAVIPVMWAVDQARDIIESGVLIGSDTAELSPTSARVYGYRQEYVAEVAVSETGEYWIAAYAIDESGTVVRSMPQPVVVVLPPGDDGPRGSHGRLPFYTGNDDDFFKRAGEPHFASIRSVESTDTLQDDCWNGLDRGCGLNFVSVNRLFASTHRDEVADVQGSPLPGGFPTDPSGLGVALSGFDRLYVPPFFPRRGLYSVKCSGGQTNANPPSVSCFQFSLDGFPPQVLLPLSRSELFSTSTSQSGDLVGHRTSSSSASVVFFIPAAPPGTRVKTAQFTTSFFAASAPDAARQPRLNGKAPVGGGISCFPGGTMCFGTATWDFTAEVRPIAGAGGGLFTVQPDLMPRTLTVRDIVVPPGNYMEDAGVLSFWVRSNYPWLHRGPTNEALTISFETEPCQKTLEVLATPGTVQPQVRPRDLIPAVAAMSTQATIDARIAACPAQAGQVVDVAFEIKPPQRGTADYGGHDHGPEAQRPVGGFGQPGGPRTARCTVRLDATGVGRCGQALTYHSSEVGGVETITTTAPGFATAERKIPVRVAGLVNAADVVTNLWRLVGGTPHHSVTDNHWGSLAAMHGIASIASDIYEHMARQGTEATIRLNDMSLPYGGLFDICGSWNPNQTCPPLTSADVGGHFSHRTGRSVDVSRSLCLGLAIDPATDCTQTVRLDRLLFERRCLRRGGTVEPEERYHCEFRE